MVSNGARRWIAGAGRRRIGAYLRILTDRRRGRPEGLCSLRDELAPRLRGIVADAIGVEADQLAPDISLANDLAVDSLDLVEVVGRVEDAFDVALPDRELASVATFGDLLAVVTALVACRLRAGEAAPATLELRVGDGVVPRFLRVVEPGAYDREILRDDLRTVHGAVAIDGPPSAALERALLRASLAGADVRSIAGGAPAVDALPDPTDDVRAWPTSRLTALAVALVEDIGAERDESIERLEKSHRLGRRGLTARRAATHARIAAFRAVVETYIDVLADVRSVLHAAARELGRLDDVRGAVDARTTSAGAVRAAYDAAADALLGFVQAIAPDTAWAAAGRRPPRAIERDGEETQAHGLTA
jgi:acyl carrier protein